MQAKELETTSISTVRSTKLDNHNMYTKHLTQIHTGSLIVTLISVRPYETCLVDSVGHVLVMSSTPTPTLVTPLLLLCSVLQSQPNAWLWISISASISYSPPSVFMCTRYMHRCPRRPEEKMASGFLNLELQVELAATQCGC